MYAPNHESDYAPLFPWGINAKEFRLSMHLDPNGENSYILHDRPASRCP